MATTTRRIRAVYKGYMRMRRVQKNITRMNEKPKLYRMSKRYLGIIDRDSVGFEGLIANNGEQTEQEHGK